MGYKVWHFYDFLTRFYMYIKFCEGSLQYIKTPIDIVVYMDNIMYSCMQLFIKGKTVSYWGFKTKFWSRAYREKFLTARPVEIPFLVEPRSHFCILMSTPEAHTRIYFKVIWTELVIILNVIPLQSEGKIMNVSTNIVLYMIFKIWVQNLYIR